MGKSVLAANALENIWYTRSVDDHHGVVFMYYDYNRAEEQDFTHVIRVLLKQLCRDHAIPPEQLHRLKQESRHVGNHSDFIAVVKDYEELYIVVDGFDECPATHRSEVVELFKASMSLSPRVKILLTSRHETGISRGLNGNGMQRLALDPSLSKPDIDAFILLEVDALRGSRKVDRLDIESDDLVQEVIEHLRSNAQGSYVLTSFDQILRWLTMRAGFSGSSCSSRLLPTLAYLEMTQFGRH